MKKNFWLLGVAVAALTSCTQNEVLEVPESKQIRFEEFVEKNSRALDNVNDLVTSNLTNYYVYGYFTKAVTGTGPYTGNFTGANKETVFEGMEMSWNNSESKWDYEETDRWVTGALYRFAAYSNGNQELTGVAYDAVNDKLTFDDYSVIDAAQIEADNSLKPLDLVASIAGDKHASTGDQPVSFTFRHLLAKVTFHLTNASNSADVSFENIQINNIAMQGDCSCVYSTGVNGYPKNVTWDITGQSTATPFEFGDVEVAYSSSSTTSDEVTFYIIPQDNASATVSLDIKELIDDEEYNVLENLTFNLATDTHYSSNPSDKAEHKWVPGYHYRYLISMGTDFKDIQFMATVDTWNKDRNGDNNPGEGADNVTPTPVP